MLLRLCDHGRITLPEDLRSDLDEGSLLEVVRRDDGIIELRPQGRIDPTQRWYWSERWQRMEQEAHADYEAGRFNTYHDVDDFLAGLDADAE